MYICRRGMYLYSLYAEICDSKAAEENSMSLLESKNDRVKNKIRVDVCACVHA